MYQNITDHYLNLIFRGFFIKAFSENFKISFVDRQVSDGLTFVHALTVMSAFNSVTVASNTSLHGPCNMGQTLNFSNFEFLVHFQSNFIPWNRGNSSCGKWPWSITRSKWFHSYTKSSHQLITEWHFRFSSGQTSVHVVKNLGLSNKQDQKCCIPGKVFKPMSRKWQFARWLTSWSPL